MSPGRPLLIAHRLIRQFLGINFSLPHWLPLSLADPAGDRTLEGRLRTAAILTGLCGTLTAISSPNLYFKYLAMFLLCARRWSYVSASPRPGR